MGKNILKSFLFYIIFIIILGLLYPLVVTGISRIIFPAKSQGSLIYAGQNIVGSELIGQNFIGDKYFHPRPSAAGKDGYDAMSSSGSNLAPTNEDFISTVSERLVDFKKENNLPDNTIIPADIVTASGSGLDPNISIESAMLQVERISKARGIPVNEIQDLIAKNRENRILGFLGEPKVNVLKLNLLLDNLHQ
jgi:potassium-transporting ATPase KdpC subunit